MQTTWKQEFADRAGIFLSGLCLVHCTALPLAMAGMQAWGSTNHLAAAEDERFHLVFAFLLLVVGGTAFVRGFLKHRQQLPLVAGIIGTAILFVGACNPFHLLTESGEHLLTIGATVVLIAAHVQNRRDLHVQREVPCVGHAH